MPSPLIYISRPSCCTCLSLLCLLPYRKYTTSPIDNHIPIVIHAYMFRNAATPRQETIPRTGIYGEKGVLKCRGYSGCFFRNIKIARQTAAKASKVPSDTNLLRTPIGKKPPNNIAIIPTIMLLIYGVLKR